jgi:polyhydroxyalkanoate synthesis repressor PhaR
MSSNHAAAGSAADTPGDDVKRLRIRKYPNRRYYDSTRSRHLTLDEIYQAIRDGYEIEVTDSKSGQDITAKVLAQMIIELDPPKLGVFPVPLLHRLLRANEQLVSDFTRKYFSQALDAFLDSQKKFEHSLRSAMGLKSSTPTVADWTRIMWGPFNPATWNEAGDAGGSATGGAAAAETDRPGRGGELSAVIEQLRGQVADLEKQLGRKNRTRASSAAARRAKKPSRR